MIKQAGLFTFPWDFVDEGVDELVGTARDLGVTHLIVASAYHAGFFLYPHNPRRKAHLLEDGVAYFHPNMKQYIDGPIRPRVASMCQDHDWFAVICAKAVAAGLKVCAWTVFCHNTPIGLAHPEATIHNAFGDSYPHALSPGHPATVAYCRALVDDLAGRYPLDLILLEAVDYRRRRHGGDWVAGHHHERDGTHLRPLEMALMDLSFNLADVQRAQGQGVDVAALRSAVREHLQRCFDQAPDIPADLPETIEQFDERYPDLVVYRRSLHESEQAMATQLKDAAHKHDVKLIGAGPTVDFVMAGTYGQSIEQIQRTTEKAHSNLLKQQQLAVMIRMGFNTPGLGTPITSEQQMIHATQAAARGGADFIGYYNYAEAPRRCVQWVRPALQIVGLATTSVG